MSYPHCDINHFVNRYHDHQHCLLVDGKIFYRVLDEKKFYKALGYTREWSDNGYLPEEYFWVVFRSPQAERHQECLPFLFATYLLEVSNEFRDSFGDEFDEIAGQCNFKKKAESLPCLTCIHYRKFQS